MAYKRSDEWEEDTEAYTAAQVENILEYCGVEVDSSTYTHFICFCPFHGNTDSPAFAVDKVKGLWTCFNPSCEQAGALLDLPRRLKGLNMFQSLRLVAKYRNASSTPIDEIVRENLKPKEFPSMSDDKIEQMHNSLWDSPGLNYMVGRGFTEETLSKFKVGYSPARIYPPPYKSRPEMVTVPMYDIKGNGVGVIGRSIKDKSFKNSTGLPRSETAFNIHNARRTGGTVITVEASFDAMSVHQAGYPNVVGLLGGSASPLIVEQLNKHFDTVIHMTDFESTLQFYPNCKKCNYKQCVGHRPGRELARSLIRQMPNTRHLWAVYDETCVFPDGKKDATDMTDDEIRQCLKNAISNLEYTQWNPESLAG